MTGVLTATFMHQDKTRHLLLGKNSPGLKKKIRCEITVVSMLESMQLDCINTGNQFDM